MVAGRVGTGVGAGVAGAVRTGVGAGVGADAGAGAGAGAAAMAAGAEVGRALGRVAGTLRRRVGMAVDGAVDGADWTGGSSPVSGWAGSTARLMRVGSGGASERSIMAGSALVELSPPRLRLRSLRDFARGSTGAASATATRTGLGGAYWATRGSSWPISEARGKRPRLAAAACWAGVSWRM